MRKKYYIHFYGLSYVLLDYFGILNSNALFFKMPKIMVFFKGKSFGSMINCKLWCTENVIITGSDVKISYFCWDISDAIKIYLLWLKSVLFRSSL